MSNGCYGIENVLNGLYGMDSTNLQATLADRFSDVFDMGNARNGKIQAIKEFRRATGCGLKDAKDAVEAIMEMATTNNTEVVNLNRSLKIANDDNERLYREIGKLRAMVETLLDSADSDTLKQIIKDSI